MLKYNQICENFILRHCWLVLCISGDVKDDDTKKQNFVIFRTEKVFKSVVLAKSFTLKGIFQYLMHLTKRYCHIKISISLILMDVRLFAYEHSNKVSIINSFYH